MNKPIKLIIIDLDGTIINSGPDLIDSLNFVLNKQEMKNVDKKIVGNLVGGGAQSMIEKAFKHLGHQIPLNKMDSMINDFLRFYYENCDKKSQLYPLVAETLKILKSKFKLAICTNKKQFLTEKILKSFKIDSYFDFVLGSCSDLKLKPDVEMLEKCLKECSEKPENSVMVGDSDNDIIPANNLLMRSIFVTYGYGELNESLHSNFIINRFDELTNKINY